VLVAEVRSPGVAILGRKRAEYEVIGFELAGGRYREAAHVTGDETFAAVRPFPIEVVPSRLVAGLQPGIR